MEQRSSVSITETDPELEIDIDTITNMDDKLATKQANKEKRKFYKLMILTWITRAIPIGGAFSAIALLLIALSNSSNWLTNDDSSDQDKLKRTQNRGQFVSVLSAIFMNIIGAFMFNIKVKESLVITNYGFILAPVIGYMLDQAIGTDDGFKQFMTVDGVSYTFGSLMGGNFMRYIVTIFLDLFISNPLQDVLKVQAIEIGIIEKLHNPNGKTNKWLIKYDRFVAMNYPSQLQSIVSFVTFNAYTNQTRFAWAYPDETLARELRIPPGTIMLCTAIAGVLYLNFYTIMDYISDREYFDINTKLIYVTAILFLLYGLNSYGAIEAPVEGEDDPVYANKLGAARAWLGLLVFIGFVMYGFVYPLYTRLGCCGYGKPDPNEEIDEPSTAKIRKSPRYKTAYINRYEPAIDITIE